MLIFRMVREYPTWEHRASMASFSRSALMSRSERSPVGCAGRLEIPSRPNGGSPFFETTAKPSQRWIFSRFHPSVSVCFIASSSLAMTIDAFCTSTSQRVPPYVDRPAVKGSVSVRVRFEVSHFRPRCEVWGEVPATVRSMRIRCVRTSFRSPWQNGIAERWIESYRRDLLDHIIAVDGRHFKRLLSEYVRYYHLDRTHPGLGKETPGRRIRSVATGRIISHDRLGGLHHRYDRAA